MTRISSHWTFFYKRVFPVMWFGFIAFFLLSSLAVTLSEDNPPPAPVFAVPFFLAVFGYGLMKTLIFDMVDEVWDCGDALFVRNRGLEERIPLGDFMNLSYNNFVNPPRATLRLRRESQFGSEIVFCGPISWVPFTTPPIMDDLIERIDQARIEEAVGRS